MSAAQRAAWASFARAVGAFGGSRRRREFDARIVVLGGSMVAGSNCIDATLPQHSAACAYPKRVLGGLVDIFSSPGDRSEASTSGAVHEAGPVIDWVSHATGGMTTASVLPSVPSLLSGYAEEAADLPTLLLIDFSANDALEPMLTPPIAKAALESLLRYVLGSLPTVALLLVETYAGPAPPPPPDSPRSRPHGCEYNCGYRPVAARYGVPHMRYGRLLRNLSSGWAAPRGADGLDPTPHPWWGTHALIADGVLGGMMALFGELDEPAGRHEPSPAPSPPLPPALSPAALLAAHSLCVSPLSLYSARASLQQHSTQHRSASSPRFSGEWRLVEERRGKPGWVHSGSGGSIEFDLSFGARGRAMLSYLRGYDADFGEARLQMGAVRWPGYPSDASLHPTHRLRLWERNSALVDAMRSDGVRVTQAAVLTLQVGDERVQDYAHNARRFPRHFPGILGFGLPPHANATLRLTVLCRRAPRCRFKVLGVTAC